MKNNQIQKNQFEFTGWDMCETPTQEYSLDDFNNTISRKFEPRSTPNSKKFLTKAKVADAYLIKTKGKN